MGRVGPTVGVERELRGACGVVLREVIPELSPRRFDECIA
jgi:hypothetical protein